MNLIFIFRYPLAMLFIKLSYHVSFSATSNLNFSDFYLLPEFYVFLPVLAPDSRWTHSCHCSIFSPSYLSSVSTWSLWVESFQEVFNHFLISQFRWFHCFCFVKFQTKVVFSIPFLSLTLQKVECHQKVAGSIYWWSRKVEYGCWREWTIKIENDRMRNKIMGALK